MLEELGLPYECVRIDIRTPGGRPEGYEAIHPLGLVPVLEYEGQRIFESQAICMFVADRHPEAGLAPPVDSPERAAYYQWCAFAIGTLEPAVFQLAVLRSDGTPDDHPKMKEAVARTERVFAVLEEQLSGRSFVIGEQFTTADVLNGQIADWGRNLRGYGPLFGVLTWLKRLQRRGGWLRSLDDSGI